MDTIVFQSSLITVGLFRAKPWEPNFEDSGPTQGYLVVFPRTSVIITHAGREPVITSPNVVMFYNLGQEYRREKVSERGDICEWFAFHPSVVADALKPYDCRVIERIDHPFRFTHGPSDATTFLVQRLVVEHLLENAHPDTLFVQESLLEVLARSLANRYGLQARKKGSGQINPEHKDLARAAQQFLATHFSDSLTLEDLASALNYSQYHLARIFHQQTGQTIHQFLDQLRLRTALEEITAGDKNLTHLAYTLGYSSHSHFSQSFKRTFGHPPSNLREFAVSPTGINFLLSRSQPPFTKRAKI